MMREQLDRLEGLHKRVLLLLEQQAILTEFSRTALQTGDLDQLLQIAPPLAARGLRTGFIKVMQYMPEDNDFLVVAGHGWDDDVVGHARIGTDHESPAGFAFLTQSPVMTNDLDAQDRYRVPQLLIEHGVNSAINVIIDTRQGRWGVFEADSRDRDAFSYEDTNFLYGFANVLGIAISNANERSAKPDRDD